MFDRRWVALVFTILATLAGAGLVAAQCVGHMTEQHDPPAVKGISTSSTGLTVRYWAWDDLNNRRGGDDSPLVVDALSGVMLAELDWAQAEVCLDPGPVGRTAVLFEDLGPDGFGRWAIVNLGAGPSGEIDVDESQVQLGQVSSRVVAVPSPWISEVRVEPETIEVELGWSLNRAGEALSDLVDGDGWRLPSVRGYATYVVNGLEPTSRPWDWSFGRDVEPDAVNGFSTDTSTTVRLTRGMWGEQTVCFALALTFDGNGDAEGELEDSRSVHGDYLGAPSPWLRLPPLGVDLPVAIVDLEARLLAPDVVRLRFAGQAEPDEAQYLVWILRDRLSRPYLLAVIDGGAGTYLREFELPPWSGLPLWSLAVEMLDGDGRTIDYEVTKPVR